MKINSISLTKLEIPFKTSFKHASAERQVTEAVIAKVRDSNNLCGYGEGCPRHYVTGETIDSCMKFISDNQHILINIDSIESLIDYLSSNSDLIDKNPAAWCAVETAILDLLAKQKNTTVESLIGIPEINGDFYYTAILGISDDTTFQKHLSQYIKMGFKDFKIKISGNAQHDNSRLKAIYENCENSQIRLDANNFFLSDKEALDYLNNLDRCFWAIEEPISSKNLSALQKLSEKVECKIILDESFLTIQDLEKFSASSNRWIVNVRISKMGGLLRSLKIVRSCEEKSMPFIIGSQVGETSILTRVALSLANTYRHSLIGQEGAYGTHLLERDITTKPIMFNMNGIVNFTPLSASGWGLDLIKNIT
jgi:L-Ala-D/L-Glu epimerase